MKKILLILVIAILSVSLFACSEKKEADGDNKTTTDSSAAADEKETAAPVEVFVIKTDYADLKYPKKWEDRVKVDVKDNTVAFSADKKPLFDLVFNGKDGFVLGTIKKDDGNIVVRIVDHKLNEKDRHYDKKISDMRDRLDVIYGMRRKYGETVEGILNYRNELEEKIDRLSSVGEKTVELEHRITDITDKLFLLHNELLDARKKASGELEVAVKRELEDLGMSGCSFSISFDGIPPKGECDFSQRELTRCEFMISTNPGEQERPLSNVASGGEISRIMLAFKNVFANIDDIDVLIFDEIDTGISGKMARVVAEKMYKISRSKQLICITHLPQIVSFGDSNYVVEKDSDEYECEINASDAYDDFKEYS